MNERTHDLLVSAVKGRYSSLRDLTEENVSSIWDNVSSHVEKQMSQMKGVQIPGLGAFCISQQKLEVGNNKFVIAQRPVFNVSEKFAQIHGLQLQKYHVTGLIPVLPLNFASISCESPFDRDTVERCVREIIRAVSLAVAAKRNVELRFSGIGRLTIREGRVKMKFYKEFINQMDGSGMLVHSLMNRSGTVDSVMSSRASSRASSRPSSSSTIILPKRRSGIDGINNTCDIENLTPVVEEEPALQSEQIVPDVLHSIHLYPEVEELPSDRSNAAAITSDFLVTENSPEEVITDFVTENAIENILQEGAVPCADNQPTILSNSSGKENVLQESRVNESFRPGSKMTIPVAKADGISLTEELELPPSPQKHSMIGEETIKIPKYEDNCIGLKPPTPPKLSPLCRSRNLESRLSEPMSRVSTPSGLSCGHLSAGQELCYLCHQRARRNIPVSFAKELKRREEEETKLLHQYQALKDAEETIKDQERHWARRYDHQKISAFNLGVAEAVQAKKKFKDTEPQRAYLFNRRPLTPSRVPKQEEYLHDLNNQVDEKDKAKQKRQEEEDFLGRLEQVQLAEDLAAQREQYLRHKAESTEAYKKALDTQVKFKPMPLPERQPDGEVFGKNDMNSEKMAERRLRAYNIYKEQQAVVEQKKRDAILAQLAEQQQEEQMLKRAKEDLRDERAFKHMVRFESRRRLENDWQNMADDKRARENEEYRWSLNPGILMHEQCDQYKRCHRCKRRLQNCGESNIWRESRYIPGTRIMV